MRKKLKTVLAGMAFLFLCMVCPLDAAAAGSMYDSPYVKPFVNPENGKKLWTIAEPLPSSTDYYTAYTGDLWPSFWYEATEETKINTGIPSSLRALATGEHYYHVDRYGDVPIGRWEVMHEPGLCIHSGNKTEFWEGLTIGHRICGKAYWSGWFAFCADCGESLTPGLVYAPRYALATVNYIDAGAMYYYCCPSCNHLENQGFDYPHACKAISWNKYKVVYEKNAPVLEMTGDMEDSFHMYNNATLYEGVEVTYSNRLSPCGYRRKGYTFAGWNTKADGTGTSYGEEAEIYNLTEYDCELDEERGTITLYAQWRRTRSTLNIDAVDGKYDGKTGVTSITQDYGTTYRVDASKITPASGYRVSFVTNGGTACSPRSAKKAFVSFRQSVPFRGVLVGDIYSFEAPDGNTDTLTAVYANGSITLPSTGKGGSSFGGWYLDAACTKPVGVAGDTYTPTADTTLYAKWVTLTLTSKNNYVANGKKGACDLSWIQSDTASKSYRVYRSGDKGKTFTQVLTASDIKAPSPVSLGYAYEGKGRSYTIPENGFYSVTAYGAQGKGYGSYSGGKGGLAQGKFYLTKGDTITIVVGGQNGYNYGGSGSVYGNGGGMTYIYSKSKGYLAIAGGGGGGSAAGAGGAGGAETSLRSDRSAYGESGQTGGGGGNIGGKAGELIVHHHSAGCYKTESKTVTGGATFYNAFSHSIEGSATMVGGSPTSTSAHVAGRGSEWKRITLQVGTAATYLSTPEAGTLTYNFNIQGVGNQHKGSVLTVYSKSGAVLTQINVLNYARYSHTVTKQVCDGEEENCHTKDTYYYTLTSPLSGTYHYTPETSWECNGEYDGLPYSMDISGAHTLSIPAGTGGVYFTLTSEYGDRSEGTSCYWDLQISNATFSYTVKKTICGYAEGEVISSKPGYGGSSYVGTGISATKTAGVRTGNGSASIVSGILGLMDGVSLSGVAAPDLAAPDRVEAGTVTITPLTGATARVTFGEVKDNGTEYQWKVESYNKASGSMMCTSNITTNTLTTGVKGYYYIVDQNAARTVTATNATNAGSPLTGRSIDMLLSADIVYLHLAAVDVAGNVGPTLDIAVPKSAMDWPVYTEQIEITDEISGVDRGTVYENKDKTVYVRADGKGLFCLSFSSYMDGRARENYQIDYQAFLADYHKPGNRQEQIAILPMTIPITNTAPLSAIEFTRQTGGLGILRDGGNMGAYRTNAASRNHFFRCFTLPLDCSGKVIVVTPKAAALGNLGYVCSDWNRDKENAISFVADGEPPEISGLPDEGESTLIDREAEEVIWNLAARDSLSGLKKFEVTVTNLEDYSSISYEADEEGSITIHLTEDFPLYSGAFRVTAQAEDMVGNVNRLERTLTEFGLSARVERILEPHEPVFRCGESGMLTIYAWGYIEKLEIEFPEMLTDLDPALNKTYLYPVPIWNRTEEYRFMIPLYAPQDSEYMITVRAYKEGEALEAYPVLSTIGVSGSVLDELRTRLR